MVNTLELTTEYLRHLVRFDTSNPPGNELPCAEYIADVLRAEGMEAQVFEPEPSRGSAVCRLRGDGSQGPVLLMSHIDVVPADASEWMHPPFAAEIHDGYMWGRGSIDTKVLTAAEMATMVTLKREGVALRRDIILAATADEEKGGHKGMGWLAENHFDAIAAEYALNEGGGFGIDMDGRRVYLCQTGQKGSCWLKLTAHGPTGHTAAVSGPNSVAKLCAAVTRLAQAKLPQHRTKSVEQMVHDLGRLKGFPASVLLPLALHPAFEGLILNRSAMSGTIGSILKATLHNTAKATVLRAGEQVNVSPPEAVAYVDGRLVPGQTSEDLIGEIRPYIGDEIAVEIELEAPGFESGYASALYEVFGEVLRAHDPGAALVPFLVPGGTDGHHVAGKGIKVYGFNPLRAEPNWPMIQLAHAPNERISLANVEFCSTVLLDVVRRFCAR